MALTLTVPQQTAVTLGTGTTTVYTVPNTAGFFYVIKSIIVTNYSASAVTFSLARVVSGGSESDSNRFLKDAALAAKQTLFIDTPITLAQNESIRGLASAGSSVTVHLSGFGKVT